jgi:hypothetical protein
MKNQFLLHTKQAKANAIEAIQKAGEDYVCTIEKRKRSQEANRYYWALLKAISEQFFDNGKSYTANTWHELFKREFLTPELVELPNNETMQVFTSTKLNKEEFSDLIEQVKQFCSLHEIKIEHLENNF